jgi:quinohemoprotein ethanol dehydrogenase
MEWYYQTTPGDTWDYTATQHIILADIVIDDKQRKVLMQAPKNGFFYVLDRTNGELISADNYVYANWAERVDLTTGRPIETEFARYPDINALIAPGARGGHNWQPMAFNPTTGLVYIPAREDALWYGQEANWSFADDSRSWNTGTELNPDNENKLDSAANNFYGKLIAWDPVEQKEVWHVKEESAWNSGVLSTGDLVFKGNGEGYLSAYDAKNGEELWSYDLKTGIVASPISYEIDGVQYISILVGWGGVVGLHVNYTEQNNPGTLYTFALGSNNPFPDFPKVPEKQLIDLDYDASQEEIANGARLYDRYCSKCHGGGTIPDLKYSSKTVFNSFHSIVGEGAYLSLGMPSFKNRLNVEEIEDIRNYILSEAKVMRESLNP